jgi:hypothetical protein
VEGLADVAGYLDEFIDVTTEAVNETLTPAVKPINYATRYA